MPTIEAKQVSVAKWMAHPLNMPEVCGSSPGLARVDSEDPLYAGDIKHRRWCIYPGLKTQGAVN